MTIRRRLTLFLCLAAMSMAACMASGGSGVSTAVPTEAETAAVSTLPAPSCAETQPTPEPDGKDGLVVYGCVFGADRVGVAGVKIFRAYANYPGEQVAVSGPDGSFQAEFMPIPGDEMVRVWAELEGKTFGPGSQIVWLDGGYYWRHYGGYEFTRLDFVIK
jgi:hypothetical protein